MELDELNNNRHVLVEKTAWRIINCWVRVEITSVTGTGQKLYQCEGKIDVGVGVVVGGTKSLFWLFGMSGVESHWTSAL